jgi:hypothetical protein
MHASMHRLAPPTEAAILERDFIGFDVWFPQLTSMIWRAAE